MSSADNLGEKLDKLLLKYRLPLTFTLIALILVGFGIFYSKNIKEDKVEIIESSTGNKEGEVVVEVAGKIEKPGVYKLNADQRVEDALVLAGGLSADADRVWVEKYLNRAAKLVDGQKIFIPSFDGSTSLTTSGSQTLGVSANNNGIHQTASEANPSYNSGLININTSDAKTLDTLPGIGPVYAQNIIAQRPYSNAEELVSKGAIKRGVYEKIKSLITIY